MLATATTQCFTWPGLNVDCVDHWTALRYGATCCKYTTYYIILHLFIIYTFYKIKRTSVCLSVSDFISRKLLIRLPCSLFKGITFLG